MFNKLFGEVKRFRWVLYGMLWVGAALGVVVVVATLTNRGLVPPILQVVPQLIELKSPVCVGDRVAEEVFLEAQRPAVVDIDSALYKVSRQNVVPGTERSISSPVPQRWNRVPLPVQFEVPDTEPGGYVYVVALTPRGRSGEVAMLEIFLEIAERCGP